MTTARIDITIVDKRVTIGELCKVGKGHKIHLYESYSSAPYMIVTSKEIAVTEDIMLWVDKIRTMRDCNHIYEMEDGTKLHLVRL